MLKNNDPYIAIIELGRKNINKGITPKEALKKLKDQGFFDSEKHFTRIFKKVFHANHCDGVCWEDTKSFLELDAYFKLLEYYELKEARETSKKAHFLSYIAICFSIVAIIISGYFSYKSLTSSIKIDEKQLQRIEPVKFDSNELNNKINTILQNQKDIKSKLKS